MEGFGHVRSSETETPHSPGRHYSVVNKKEVGFIDIVQLLY